MRKTPAALFVVLMLTTALPAAAYPRPGTVEMISRSPDGAPGNNTSQGASMSGDGRYVVFHSYATNIVEGSRGLSVYLRDRETGEVTDLVPDASGSQHSPTISEDGRYVTFLAYGSNLDPTVAMTESLTLAYRLDRHTGVFRLASRSVDGGVPDASVQNLSMTPDGSMIAFSSRAGNLIAGGTNGELHAYATRIDTGETFLASQSSDKVQGNAHAFYPAVSANGRYVVFWGKSNNLVAEDSNAQDDIFLHDIQTGRTEIASLAWNGAQSNNDSVRPVISADGRYVAFSSYATNLTPVQDTANRFPYDVYVRDRATRTTERVSVSAAGIVGDASSFVPTMSSDGRYILFTSGASNLDDGPVPQDRDVFMHDRALHRTERLSVADNGAAGDGPSTSGVITDDGRLTAFASRSSTIHPQADGAEMNIYVRDRGPELGLQAVAARLDGDAVRVDGHTVFSGRLLTRAAPTQLWLQDSGIEMHAAEVWAHPEEEQLLFRQELNGMHTIPTLRDRPFVIHYTFALTTPTGPYRIRVRQKIDNTGSVQIKPVWTSTTVERCASECVLVGETSGSAGTAGSVALMTVPFEQLGLREGDRLTGIRATIAIDDPDSGDHVILHQLRPGDTSVPRRTVQLAVTAPDQTPSELDYGPALRLDDARFSTTIARPDAPAQLWTRVCYGTACTAKPTPLVTATRLQLTAPATAEYGTDVTWTLSLVDDGDRPLSGMPVQLSIGETTTTVTTGADGTAATTQTIDSDPGPLSATARYDGSPSRFAPAESTTVVEVQKAATAMTLAVERSGPLSVMTATLTGPGVASGGLGGRTVNFTVDGEAVGSAVTGADGRATLTGVKVRPTAVATATFDGDHWYVGSSASR